MLNPRSLKLFHLIAQKGSLGLAAEHFNLSPPAASRLISMLEDALGFKLFSRDGRKLAMTENGKRFLMQTLPVLSGIDSLEDIARDIRNGSAPRFRILATAPATVAWIAPTLATMHRTMPDLKCQVEVVDRLAWQSGVGDQKHDIAIGSYPLSHSVFELDTHPLCDFRFEAVFCKDHPLQALHVIEAKDLARYPLIALAKGQIGRNRMDEFLQAGGVDCQPDFEASSSLAVLALCKHGLGVSLLPSIYVQGQQDPQLASRPTTPERWISFGAFSPLDTPINDTHRAFLLGLKETASQWPGAKPTD